MESEDFWRNAINGLDIPLPEIGTDPPQEEQIVEERTDLINGLPPETKGNFSKVTMDIYFFMSPIAQKYFMMQAQNMTDYGEVSVKRAVEIVKRRQRRKG